MVIVGGVGSIDILRIEHAEQKVVGASLTTPTPIEPAAAAAQGKEPFA
jgi:hypothetical protein